MSETKQAADRLRQANEQGHDAAYFYGDERYLTDRQVIVNAYLAEHLPDDDEAITAEFMDSLTPKREDFGDAIWWTIGTVSVRMYDKRNPAVYYDTTQMSHITTRGQLRRLIEVLG